MYYEQCKDCEYCVCIRSNLLGSQNIRRCTFYPLTTRKKLRAISQIKNCDKANNKPYISREARDYYTLNKIKELNNER